jgi:hypothetical protein
VLGVLAASVPIGLFAHRRLAAADQYIAAELREMTVRGRELSTGGCVTAVVDYRARCRAMRSLCEASVPDMMKACLAARDRAAACAELGDRPMSTGFGFEACKAAGPGRRARDACAAAYRAIASHCEHARRGA